jgi:hypothetical protein
VTPSEEISRYDRIIANATAKANAGSEKAKADLPILQRRRQLWVDKMSQPPQDGEGRTRFLSAEGEPPLEAQDSVEVDGGPIDWEARGKARTRDSHAKGIRDLEERIDLSSKRSTDRAKDPAGSEAKWGSTRRDEETDIQDPREASSVALGDFIGEKLFGRPPGQMKQVLPLSTMAQSLALGKSPENKRLAELGDEEARMQESRKSTAASRAGMVASMPVLAGGLALGSSGVLANIAEGVAQGAVEGGVESAALGDGFGRGAAKGGLVGGALATPFALAGGLARNRMASYRDLLGKDPDFASLLRTAEGKPVDGLAPGAVGGYRTSLTRGMKPEEGFAPLGDISTDVAAQRAAREEIIPTIAKRDMEVTNLKKQILGAGGEDVNPKALKAIQDIINDEIEMATLKRTGGKLTPDAQMGKGTNELLDRIGNAADESVPMGRSEAATARPGGKAIVDDSNAETLLDDTSATLPSSEARLPRMDMDELGSSRLRGIADRTSVDNRTIVDDSTILDRGTIVDDSTLVERPGNTLFDDQIDFGRKFPEPPAKAPPAPDAPPGKLDRFGQRRELQAEILKYRREKDAAAAAERERRLGAKAAEREAREAKREEALARKLALQEKALADKAALGKENAAIRREAMANRLDAKAQRDAAGAAKLEEREAARAAAEAAEPDPLMPMSPAAELRRLAPVDDSSFQMTNEQLETMLRFLKKKGKKNTFDSNPDSEMYERIAKRLEGARLDDVARRAFEHERGVREIRTAKDALGHPQGKPAKVASYSAADELDPKTVDNVARRAKALDDTDKISENKAGLDFLGKYGDDGMTQRLRSMAAANRLRRGPEAKSPIPEAGNTVQSTLASKGRIPGKLRIDAAARKFTKAEPFMTKGAIAASDKDSLDKVSSLPDALGSFTAREMEALKQFMKNTLGVSDAEVDAAVKRHLLGQRSDVESQEVQP